MAATRPRFSPRRYGIASLIDTPRQPKRASSPICAANAAGVTYRQRPSGCSASGTSATLWYIRIGVAMPPPFFRKRHGSKLSSGVAGSAADRELAEIHAEVPPGPGAAQRQRDIALGHHRAVGRRGRAGMRAAGRVGSEDLVDVEDAGEFADAIDLLLAE